MDLFDLEEDAMVRSPSGEALGEIESFVVDPSTRNVSHVVVKEGLLFKDRRVVAVDQIDYVDAEGPVLTIDIEPEDLPLYEVEHYVPLDSETRNRFDPRMGQAAMYRYPPLVTGYYPGYPGLPLHQGAMPATRTVTELNVPETSAVIGEDTEVQSAAGNAVGEVREITIDEEGRLSHLRVNLRALDGERDVPAEWIDSISGDKVVLAVGEEALGHLQDPPNGSV